MILIHTTGGSLHCIKSFREVPTPSRAFCPAEWRTDPGWIPGMEWIEAVTADNRAIMIRVAHIDTIHIEEEVA